MAYGAIKGKEGKKMKKLMVVMLVLSALLTGCDRTAELIKPKTVSKGAESTVTEPNKKKKVKISDERKTKILLSQQLRGQQDWTVMGSYYTELTKHATDDGKDRVLLWTEAKPDNGEMKWDETHYWALAVVTNDGAYNLYYKQLAGELYCEVNEIYISGVATDVITLYIFSEKDREIRNYIYDEDDDVFVEDQVFATGAFSTAGVSNKYSTIPESKPL